MIINWKTSYITFVWSNKGSLWAWWQPMEELEWVVALVTSLGLRVRPVCRGWCQSVGGGRGELSAASRARSLQSVSGKQPAQDQEPGMTVRGWSPECDNSDISHQGPVTRRPSSPPLPAGQAVSVTEYHWLHVVKYPHCFSLLRAAPPLVLLLGKFDQCL